jgi:hypothetical protein
VISRTDNTLLEKIASHIDIAFTEKMNGELEVKTDFSGAKVMLTPEEIGEITRIVSGTAGLAGDQVR